MVNQITVLIPDGESPFSLAVVRCLADVPHVRLNVLANSSSAAPRYSRHRATFCTHKAVDESKQLDAIIETARLTNSDVLLPIDEPMIEFVTNHYETLAQEIKIAPVPTPAMFKTATDKWKLAQFAHTTNLPIPPTTYYHNKTELFGLLNSLQFPVLFKPTQERGGTGVRKFDSLQALQQALVQPQNNLLYEPHIIQQYIEGHDIDCSILCQHGEIKAYTLQKGFLPGWEKFSAPAGINFIENERLLEVAQQLTTALNWNGIAHVDLRYDAHADDYKIIEINARFWGSLMGSHLVGVNFPYLACLLGLGHPFDAPEYQLAPYVAPSVALKEWLLRIVQRKPLQFSFADTGISYILKDPLSEITKLYRRWL